MNRSGRWQKTALALVAGIILGVLVLGSGAAQARQYGALRINGDGVEGEVFLDPLGFMIARSYDVATEKRPGCTGTFDRIWFGMRYFWKGVGDTFFVGLTRSDDLIVSADNCNREVFRDKSRTGFGPLLGYHWLWKSGLSLELGFRPGAFAVGWTF